MTSRLLILFLVLMTFLVIDDHSFDPPTFTGTDFELSNTPDLNIEPIQNPSFRTSSNHQNYIADPFIPMVVLAYSLYEERDFAFYLLRYELHRKKEFVLIV